MVVAAPLLFLEHDGELEPDISSTRFASSGYSCDISPDVFDDKANTLDTGI